jgi:tetratricopeptide (TPR) repeat protein
MFHVSQALSVEPTQAEARKLLDRIISAAPDPLALVPLEGQQIPYPRIAAHAYILAQRGNLDRALLLMNQIFKAFPDAPYLPWIAEWLSPAERVDTVALATMQNFLIGLMRKFPDNYGNARPHIEQLVPAFTRMREQHPDEGFFASMTSILVRKLGRLDEAIQIAQAAYDRSPNYQTAAILGTAQSERQFRCGGGGFPGSREG